MYLLNLKQFTFVLNIYLGVFSESLLGFKIADEHEQANMSILYNIFCPCVLHMIRGTNHQSALLSTNVKFSKLICVYLHTKINSSFPNKDILKYWLTLDFDPGNFSVAVPKIFFTKHRLICVVDVYLASVIDDSNDTNLNFGLSVVQKLQNNLQSILRYQPDYFTQTHPIL